MGSGPIVIGDCGGPPPTLELMESSTSHMRVGRTNEGMSGLMSAHGLHMAVNARRIEDVNIYLNGAVDEPTSTYQASKVDILGNQGSDISVQVVGGVVIVSTSAALSVENVPDFGNRYVAPDLYIQSVSLNDGDVIITHGGTTENIRVEIEIS